MKEVNSIWNDRFKDFFINMANYFSIIGMSVFYSFIILGSFFVYYYLKLLQWLSPHFLTEMIVSVVVAFIFLGTKVRTFVKEADIIYLKPMEGQLVAYFKRSIIYSTFFNIIKFTIILIIISPLIKNSDMLNSPFLLIYFGLIFMNIRLTWVEQWLNDQSQKVIHRLVRFLLFSTILYFLFMGNWLISGVLVAINMLIYYYAFGKNAQGVNWAYLINEEQKSLVKIYKFINIYIDVPQFRHSFRRRRLLGWCIKKAVTYKQSSSYTYLFSHLFIRYNEFYYLYIRLSLLGFGIIYFFPTSGLFVTVLTLALTGYQILPLQHSINDSARLYPISSNTIRKSLKKLVMALLILQLILLNMASFIHVIYFKSIIIIFMELVFVYWFVYVFLSKRINVTF